MSKSSRGFLMAGLSVAMLALALSACSSPTPEVTAAPTERPAATKAPTVKPATTEAPTEKPAATEAATEKPTEAMTEAAGSDSVTASEQKLGADNSLVVAKVMAAADGWIVIHADSSGKPGTVLGYAAVKKGENDNVKVTLTDTKDLTGAEWAMLHVDAGKVGTYEFPGADGPVKDLGGSVVMMSFKVTK